MTDQNSAFESIDHAWAAIEPKLTSRAGLRDSGSVAQSNVAEFVSVTTGSDVLGEHHSVFSNAYEKQLRDEGAAIGESAQSDHQLDAFLKTLGASDDNVQKALLSRNRRHDLQFAASVACLFKTATKSMGYLDNLLDECEVAVAKNAASPERAKISAIIRFAASSAASTRDVSVRVSRLSKTAVGVILLCENLSIAVHLGNIAQVIDIALGQSRFYFQKLVDAHDDAEAAKSTPKIETEVAAPPTSNTSSAASSNAETLDADATPETDTQQAEPETYADAGNPKPVTLKVLPSRSVSEPVRPALIGTVPNKGALGDGIVVLIGRVTGDDITVHGPITTPLADELLRSLEDAVRSAA